MYTHSSQYTFGDVVFLRVSGEKKPGMVTAVSFRPGGSRTYGVTWSGGTESWHHEIELSSEYVPEWIEDTAKGAAGQ